MQVEKHTIISADFAALEVKIAAIMAEQLTRTKEKMFCKAVFGVEELSHKQWLGVKRLNKAVNSVEVKSFECGISDLEAQNGGYRD